VRAAIAEVLRIGGIRIFLSEPTPSRAPLPTPAPVASVLDLPGETTLDDARSRAPFDILLPAYPPDLGQPDRVFVQDLAGPVVTLVWLADNPTRVRLSLQILDESVVGSKFEPPYLENTTVNGQPAAWVMGEHTLAFYNGRSPFIRIVTQNLLIWEQSAITYRLETDDSLEEARRIAESLE